MRIELPDKLINNFKGEQPSIYGIILVSKLN